MCARISGVAVIGVSERWLVCVLKTTRRREDEVVFLASFSTPRLKIDDHCCGLRQRRDTTKYSVQSKIVHSSRIKHSMSKYNQYAA